MGMFFDKRCPSKWVHFPTPNTHIRAFHTGVAPRGRNTGHGMEQGEGGGDLSSLWETPKVDIEDEPLCSICSEMHNVFVLKMFICGPVPILILEILELPLTYATMPST